jgi:hypothetical protein
MILRAGDGKNGITNYIFNEMTDEKSFRLFNFDLQGDGFPAGRRK